MDVMEALRLTQLKLNQISGEVAELRQAFQTVLSQNYYRPVSAPAAQDTSAQQNRTGPEAQRQLNEKAPSSHTTAVPDLLIIGDSNVRRLETSANPPGTSFWSTPGASTDQLDRELAEVPDKSLASTIVFHSGTNDLARKGSEKIAADLVNLAQRTKARPGIRQVYICSVTSRKDLGSFVYSRSESVNNRLRSLCMKTHGVKFIDLRERLEKCTFTGLARDALHYNKAGASCVLNAISDSVGGFLTHR